MPTNVMNRSMPPAAPPPQQQQQQFRPTQLMNQPGQNMSVPRYQQHWNMVGPSSSVLSLLFVAPSLILYSECIPDQDAILQEILF